MYRDYLRRYFKIARQICLFQATAFITSLPFLVANGLAISHLSLLGNLFLNPAIFIFMLLGATIFFCEILGLYQITKILHIYLEYTCCFWHKTMTFFKIDPLFNLSINQAFFVFIFTSFFISIFIIKKIKWSKTLLTTYLILTILLLDPIKTWSENLLHNNTSKKLFFEKGTLLVSRDNNGTIYIIENKEFKKCKRRSGFVDFELKPTLAREFGKTSYVLKSTHKNNLYYFK